MNKILFSFLFVLASILQINAQIDTSLYQKQLEDLIRIPVKTGGVYSQSVFESLKATSVIDEAKIKEYGFQTVAEAISTLAGIYISRTYLTQNMPTARGILQTHYANKILILINGIPTWFSMTNEGFIDRININDVKKIEVLKGPASVIYGTNAYTAAINIVLKNAGANNGSAAMTVGSGYTIGAGSNYSFIKNKWKFFISANSLRQDGFKDYFTGEDGKSGFVKDKFNKSNFTLMTSYKTHTLLFNAFDLGGINFGPRLSFLTGAGKDASIYGYLLYYSYYKKISKKSQIYHDIAYDWNNRDLTISLDSRRHVLFEGYRIADNIRFVSKLTDRLKLHLGTNIEYRQSSKLLDYDSQTDSIISYKIDGQTFNVYNNGMYKKGIWETSAYMQLQYIKENFSVLGGYRLTYNQQYKINNSFSATFLYKINSLNTLKIFYGNSYRSPSIFETNLIYPVVLGNPYLKPELSRSMELSYSYNSNYLSMKALTYYTKYKNLIIRQFISTKNPMFQFYNTNGYFNGKDLTTAGFETELNYENPQIISFFINYTYLKDLKNGKDYYLNFVPHHMLTFGIAKNIKHFKIATISNIWSGTDGPIKPIPAQWWTNFNLSYNFCGKRIKFVHEISIKNIFNRQIVVPEFVRQNINALPVGIYRFFSYSFKIEF